MKGVENVWKILIIVSGNDPSDYYCYKSCSSTGHVGKFFSGKDDILCRLFIIIVLKESPKHLFLSVVNHVIS